MTTADETKTPAGMAEVSAKFEHEHAADPTSTEAAPNPDHTTGKTEIARIYEQALGFQEQARKAIDRDDGHASDRLYETFFELRDEIMQTPATCPQDVAVKLRLYADMMDIADRPETLPEMGDNAAEGYLRIAICDLERLGGEARS